MWNPFRKPTREDDEKAAANLERLKREKGDSFFTRRAARKLQKIRDEMEDEARAVNARYDAELGMHRRQHRWSDEFENKSIDPSSLDKMKEAQQGKPAGYRDHASPDDSETARLREEMATTKRLILRTFPDHPETAESFERKTTEVLNQVNEGRKAQRQIVERAREKANLAGRQAKAEDVRAMREKADQHLRAFEEQKLGMHKKVR